MHQRVAYEWTALRVVKRTRLVLATLAANDYGFAFMQTVGFVDGQVSVGDLIRDGIELYLEALDEEHDADVSKD